MKKKIKPRPKLSHSFKGSTLSVSILYKWINDMPLANIMLVFMCYLIYLHLLIPIIKISGIDLAPQGKLQICLPKRTESLFTIHSQEHPLSFSPRLCKFE